MLERYWQWMDDIMSGWLVIIWIYVLDNVISQEVTKCISVETSTGWKASEAV